MCGCLRSAGAGRLGGRFTIGSHCCEGGAGVGGCGGLGVGGMGALQLPERQPHVARDMGLSAGRSESQHLCCAGWKVQAKQFDSPVHSVQHSLVELAGSSLK